MKAWTLRLAALAAATLLGALYFRLVVVAARLLVNVCLKLYLGFIKDAMPIALRLIVSDGKTYICLALALLFAAGGPALWRWLARPWAGIRGLPWFLAAATILALGSLAVEFRQRASNTHANRFGFYPPFGSGSGPFVLKR